MKINDNIFSEGELFPLKAYHCWNYNLKTVPLPTAIHKLLIRSACIPNRRKHENPMDDRGRGQSRSTVGQNLHILYITGHLYDLDGYEKWRGFGLCRWRPLGFSNLLVIDIHYADRVQSFNSRPAGPLDFPPPAGGGGGGGAFERPPPHDLGSWSP